MRGLALPPAPLGRTSPGLAAADRSPPISRRRAMRGHGGEPSSVADPETAAVIASQVGIPPTHQTAGGRGSAGGLAIPKSSSARLTHHGARITKPTALQVC